MKTFNEWMNAEFGELKYPPLHYSDWQGWANCCLRYKNNESAKITAQVRTDEYNQYVKNNIKYPSLEEYMIEFAGKRFKGTWEEWLADPNQKVYQDIWYPKYQAYKKQLLTAALFSVATPEGPPVPKKPIRMLN